MSQPVTDLNMFAHLCDIIPCIHSLPPKSKNLKNIFPGVFMNGKHRQYSLEWLVRWETLGSIILPKRYK